MSVKGIRFRYFAMAIARAESTGRYPHEEDTEEHKVVSSVPVQGFFRIWTRERNLDLLFVTLLAFARTGASADNGGNRKTLFNTLKNRYEGRRAYL